MSAMMSTDKLSREDILRMVEALDHAQDVVTENTTDLKIINVLCEALYGLFMAVMGFYAEHKALPMSRNVVSVMKMAYKARSNINAPVWNILSSALDCVVNSPASNDIKVIRALSRARKALQTDDIRQRYPRTNQLPDIVVMIPVWTQRLKDCDDNPILSGYSVKDESGSLLFHGSQCRVRVWLETNNYRQNEQHKNVYIKK